MRFRPSSTQDWVLLVGAILATSAAAIPVVRASADAGNWAEVAVELAFFLTAFVVAALAGMAFDDDKAPESHQSRFQLGPVDPDLVWPRAQEQNMLRRTISDAESASKADDDEGEHQTLIGVVGPSGCGKSTTVRAVLAEYEIEGALVLHANVYDNFEIERIRKFIADRPDAPTSRQLIIFFDQFERVARISRERRERLKAQIVAALECQNAVGLAAVRSDRYVEVADLDLRLSALDECVRIGGIHRSDSALAQPRAALSDLLGEESTVEIILEACRDKQTELILPFTLQMFGTFLERELRELPADESAAERASALTDPITFPSRIFDYCISRCADRQDARLVLMCMALARWEEQRLRMVDIAQVCDLSTARVKAVLASLSAHAVVEQLDETYQLSHDELARQLLIASRVQIHPEDADNVRARVEQLVGDSAARAQGKVAPAPETAISWRSVPPAIAALILCMRAVVPGFPTWDRSPIAGVPPERTGWVDDTFLPVALCVSLYLLYNAMFNENFLRRLVESGYSVALTNLLIFGPPVAYSLIVVWPQYWLAILASFGIITGLKYIDFGSKLPSNSIGRSAARELGVMTAINHTSLTIVGLLMPYVFREDEFLADNGRLIIYSTTFLLSVEILFLMRRHVSPDSSRRKLGLIAR